MTGSNYASITESRSSRNTITALQKPSSGPWAELMRLAKLDPPGSPWLSAATSALMANHPAAESGHFRLITVMGRHRPSTSMAHPLLDQMTSAQSEM